MKTNFHTHTRRCGHASGTDEEYVKSAIKMGYQVMGFADHTPWKFASDYRSTMRMNHEEEFQDYLQSIRSLRETYKDQIEIRIGLECEYFPPYMDWLRAVIQKEKLDYILLGNHFEYSEERRLYYGYKCTDRDVLQSYVQSSVEAIRTGLYAYFAHPDLFMRSYPSFDRHCEQAAKAFCAVAKEMHIPLEYNLCGAREDDRLGLHRYPYAQFWQIVAAEGCPVIIGVDAHSPAEIEDETYRKNAEKTLASYGAKIVDSIAYFGE